VKFGKIMHTVARRIAVPLSLLSAQFSRFHQTKCSLFDTELFVLRCFFHFVITAAFLNSYLFLQRPWKLKIGWCKHRTSDFISRTPCFRIFSRFEELWRTLRLLLKQHALWRVLLKLPADAFCRESE
jgi:hypothetical protein